MLLLVSKNVEYCDEKWNKIPKTHCNSFLFMLY